MLDSVVPTLINCGLFCFCASRARYSTELCPPLETAALNTERLAKFQKKKKKKKKPMQTM
jgi:hypothetical protein